MLKRFMQLLLIAGGLTVLPACSNTLSWQEEVKLNDGRVIVVTQKRRCEGAYTGQNYASCIEREAWLTVKLPELGNQEVVWHENLTPMMLNMHNDRLYVVAMPPTGREFDLYGKPQPPYLGYLFEQGRWKRIPFNEIPEAIYDTNLVIDGAQLKTKFLTLVEKASEEVNGDPAYPKPIKRIDPNFKSN